MVSKRAEIQFQPGSITRQYSEEEAVCLVTRWLEAFGMNRQGVNSKAFLWHIFSAERYSCVSGSAALAQYAMHVAPEYVILSNDRKFAFAIDSRPEKCSLLDYYVFPSNLAWTMAFTHEDGWLGPYFALHNDFAKLNEANLANLQKISEAKAAKLKGWH
ncbi:MAG: DUF4275 family protein [Pseudanabaena sp.]|jgi:hypothetical protein|nr:DUF4275 family protein [Chitinophagaceae bacterium]MCA6502838.1 DUF4275 family protein [Pseudanabaena sp. M090S1SP2A07QC]MCA6508401.1 DUF4275 family protein [Pseudanabaena sp. M172S2SP2A07QC]MCA6510215.1 DUF4275 family protein [Pseudanabaena sp. M109S1SP2A07QC]MCA6518049.1 DUF4275 family protein [Pseudanabaena sp. M110S1SP2A07QC]MCA6522085.1 DUF4275 family protein [Pseudanabaena sp. M051S1SP2A07QC]MCA6527047.1 DUF4275 family protein [Pseudanabaena sp. M179S2SP2A07QC]MCA6532115.1 DUF4275 f